jgi:hypothetical protein
VSQLRDELARLDVSNIAHLHDERSELEAELAQTRRQAGQLAKTLAEQKSRFSQSVEPEHLKAQLRTPSRTNGTPPNGTDVLASRFVPREIQEPNEPADEKHVLGESIRAQIARHRFSALATGTSVAGWGMGQA